jgi:hypothetical protein
VIAVPPLFAGALKDTLAVVAPVALALTPVGAPGTANVVIDPDALLAGPGPAAFVAMTVNV